MTTVRQNKDDKTVGCKTKTMSWTMLESMVQLRDLQQLNLNHSDWPRSHYTVVSTIFLIQILPRQQPKV